MENDNVSIENCKYNIGEPVAVYALVSSMRQTHSGEIFYNLEIKDDNHKLICMAYDVPEDIVTTVF